MVSCKTEFVYCLNRNFSSFDQYRCKMSYFWLIILLEETAYWVKSGCIILRKPSVLLVLPY